MRNTVLQGMFSAVFPLRALKGKYTDITNPKREYILGGIKVGGKSYSAPCHVNIIYSYFSGIFLRSYRSN